MQASAIASDFLGAIVTSDSSSRQSNSAPETQLAISTTPMTFAKGDLKAPQF
jgi:hypothetical protein